MNQNLNFFRKRHCRHTYGLRSNHHQLLILAQLQIFFWFTAHSVCGKKPKTIENRGHLIKIRFFSPDPKSHTQVGSLCAKNASKKFSRLGTFKLINPATFLSLGTHTMISLSGLSKVKLSNPATFFSLGTHTMCGIFRATIFHENLLIYINFLNSYVKFS